MHCGVWEEVKKFVGAECWVPERRHNPTGCTSLVSVQGWEARALK